MSRAVLEFLARSHVPQADAAIRVRPRRHGFAVWGELQERDPKARIGGVRDFCACGDIPEPNRPETRRSKNFAIGRKRQCDGVVVVYIRQGAELFAGGWVPEFERVEPRCRQNFAVW